MAQRQLLQNEGVTLVINTRRIHAIAIALILSALLDCMDRTPGTVQNAAPERTPHLAAMAPVFHAVPVCVL